MSEELKPQTLELSKKLQSFMKVNDGKVEVEKSAFEETLSGDLDAKTVKRVFNHVTDVTAAFTHAVGEMAEAACKSDTSLTDVSGKMALFNNGAISADYSRHSTRPTSVTDRTPVDVYGGIRTRVKMNAQNNSGELAKVRSSLAARGAQLFGKK